jgi:hypothetical protein
VIFLGDNPAGRIQAAPVSPDKNSPLTIYCTPDAKGWEQKEWGDWPVKLISEKP